MYIFKLVVGKNYWSFLFFGILKGLDVILLDLKEEINFFYYVCEV